MSLRRQGGRESSRKGLPVAGDLMALGSHSCDSKGKNQKTKNVTA